MHHHPRGQMQATSPPNHRRPVNLYLGFILCGVDLWPAGLSQPLSFPGDSDPGSHRARKRHPDWPLAPAHAPGSGTGSESLGDSGLRSGRYAPRSRQIARQTGDRGRGSPLIPLRSTPETPFLDQHHKMWVGPDETEQKAGGERGAQRVAAGSRKGAAGGGDRSGSRRSARSGGERGSRVRAAGRTDTKRVRRFVANACCAATTGPLTVRGHVHIEARRVVAHPPGHAQEE